jgi:hypothetical protein
MLLSLLPCSLTPPLADLGTTVAQFLQGLVQGITNVVTPLENLLVVTPPAFTTANPLVRVAWTTMTTIADAMLGLFLVTGALQRLYSEREGALHLPVGQFLFRATLTATLIQISALFGQDLLAVNNFLCILVRDILGQSALLLRLPATAGQSLLVAALLELVFLFGLIRVLLQALLRIAWFNVLFVLSGPALLCTFPVGAPFQASTVPVFVWWLRNYLVTAFTQFVQFLTLDLGFQVLTSAARPAGLVGFLFAVAALNLAAEIPRLLSHLGAVPDSTGIGRLVGGATRAALFFLS